MDVGLEIHVALVSQRCLATGAEAVALQELIDQHKAIFKEISKHKCALLLAYDCESLSFFIVWPKCWMKTREPS